MNARTQRIVVLVVAVCAIGCFAQIGSALGAPLNSPPEPFSLVSPTNFSHLLDTVVTFTWRPAIDPDAGDQVHYNLRVVGYIVPPFLPDTTFVQNITDTSVTITLDPNREFHWRVFAIDQLGETTPSTQEWIFSNCNCGNADGFPILGVPDISDAVYMIQAIFQGGWFPEPACLGDADGSGGTPDISDVVFIIVYIFGGGPAPCCIGSCQ